MAILDFTARRLIVAGGFAAAIAVAPAVAVVAGPSPSVGAQTAACPPGEHADQFTSVCVPYLVPSSGTPGDGGATSESLDDCLRQDQPNCIEQEGQGSLSPGDTDFPGAEIPVQ